MSVYYYRKKITTGDRNELMHYGVKGMKWGKRRNPYVSPKMHGEETPINRTMYNALYETPINSAAGFESNVTKMLDDSETFRNMRWNAMWNKIAFKSTVDGIKNSASYKVKQFFNNFSKNMKTSLRNLSKSFGRSIDKGKSLIDKMINGTPSKTNTGKFNPNIPVGGAKMAKAVVKYREPSRLKNDDVMRRSASQRKNKKKR